MSCAFDSSAPSAMSSRSCGWKRPAVPASMNEVLSAGESPTASIPRKLTGRPAGARSAVEAARRAPRGELRVYPGVDHFDIYDGPEHETVVADEVVVLSRRLHARPNRSPD